MRRRRFLKTAPAVGVAGLAGCPANDADTEDTSDSSGATTTKQQTQAQSPDSSSNTPSLELRSLDHPETITRGENATLRAEILNRDSRPASTTVVLNVANQTLSETLEVEPNTVATVTFYLGTITQTGSFEFELIDQSEGKALSGEIQITSKRIDLPWSQLPGPSGGPVTYISISRADPGAIYASTRTAGIFASDDYGASWIQGFSGQHHRPRIWASPHDPDTAYTKLERTDNAGRRWYGKLSSDDPIRDRHGPWNDDLLSARVYQMQWSPLDANIIYAATPNGLYRTSDDGQTWKRRPIDGAELPPAYAGWDFATHPTKEGVLTAGLGDNVATTTDHGETWSLIDLGERSNGLRNKFIRGVEYAEPNSDDVYLAVQGEGVYKLADGNLTELTTDLPKLVYPKIDLPLSPSATRKKLYFIAGRSTEMYPVRDWWDDRKLYVYDTNTDKVRVVDTPMQPNSVTTHPADDKTLFSGGESWIHKSTDGGQTWQPLANGFVDHYLSTVAVNTSHPQTVFPGSICSTGLSVSQDSGQSFDWKRSGLGPWHQGEFGEHYMMHAAAAGDRAYATTSAGLLISSDNGNSWRLLDNRFSGQGDLSGANNHLHGLVVHPSAPETVYVGTGRGGGGGGHDTFDGAKLWKSQDGGASWDEITDGFPSHIETTVQDITVNPHDPETVYVGTNEVDYLGGTRSGGRGVGLYRSTNGGSSWEELPTPFENVHAVTVDAADSDTVYASEAALAKPWRDSGVYRSTDGGESWERVLPHVSHALKAHPTEGGVLFAGSRKYQDYWEVLISEDGGETWAEGNLRIRASTDPAGPELDYDAAERHSDYWGNSSGQIMWFAHDPENSLLYAATNGVGLWQADTSELE